MKVGDWVRVREGLKIDHIGDPQFINLMGHFGGVRTRITGETKEGFFLLHVGYCWKPEWLIPEYVDIIKDLLNEI